MCLFSLLFVAMGGELWRRWCICMSQGELWAQKFPRNYADDFSGVLSVFFLSLSLFFFFSQNRPRAGSWRWKMSGLTAFERFILQRWCTFITVTSINDILSCKLEMHQGCFFFFFFLFFFKTSKTKQWTKCVLSAEIECCAWYLSESHFLSTLEI